MPIAAATTPDPRGYTQLSEEEDEPEKTPSRELLFSR